MGAQHHHSSHDTFRQRVDQVRGRVDIVAVVGRVVKLGRGKAPRGKCPFHGSKSDSFTLYPDTGRARCWGCQWAGDVIKFVQDFYGLDFVEALRRLEEEGRLDDLREAPVRRAKRERQRRESEPVSSAVMGAWLWHHARSNPDAIRLYLRSRGVPERMLGDDRLSDIRFLADAPIAAWPTDRGPADVLQAPAMIALVRRPYPGRPGEWMPTGVHVTYLSPDLTGKMVRERRNGSLYPARKMMGSIAGGGVLLGQYDPDVALFPGEGIETVLSGMAIAGAPDSACGLATLSLGNLQGEPRTIRGALPLYEVRPDPDRSPALAFPHRGRVVGLVDADMAPLKGWQQPGTDRFQRPRIIERRGGPVVERIITTAERAEICGTLLVHAWRACGCRVAAVRPRMGRDFNDAAREVGA
jgi:DNA primase